MDTTQVTQVPRNRVSTSRRGLVALIAGLAVAGGIAFGIKATAAEPAATTPAFTPVSVAAGHTQPATTIYRIAMHPEPQRRG
jgi:hypothetical protein